jgi:hypothetical protein
MRRDLALFLVFITLIALPTWTVKAEIDAKPVINVQRDIEIVNAGILFMNDTYTLEAPSETSVRVAEFNVGFHSSFIDERHSFEIWQDNSWKAMSYRESDLGDERFRGYKIELPSPVSLQDGATLTFRASYLFVNRVSWVSDGYSARIPVYPALMCNISMFKLHVSLPADAEFIEVSSPLNITHVLSDGSSMLEYESEAVGPLRNENATITYVPSPEDEELLDCGKFERHITIKQGSLRVEDTYTLINLGNNIYSFHLKIPPDASNINARDGVGPLMAWSEEEEEGADHVDAYVAPRTTFKQWERWVFTIGYSLPKEGRLASEGGSPTLTYSVYGFPHYVRKLSAVVTLPEGAKLIASEPEFSSIEETDHNLEVFIDLGARLPSERPTIVVEFSSSLFWPAIRSLGLLLIAIGALGSVYVMRKRRKVVEKEPVEAERPKLSDFLDNYRERISLLMELEGLEQDLERKKIGRDRFDQRSAEINRRQRELTRSLRQLGRAIEAEDPDLRSRLREIRRAEEELERVNVDLRNLEVRLRARRVSRRNYGRRRRDHLKRRSRAVRRIEQTLSSISAEK